MKFTIERFKEPLTVIDDNRKPITMYGYAFVDEFGCTIIITYGEGKRDAMEKYLSGPTDELHIKY